MGKRYCSISESANYLRLHTSLIYLTTRYKERENKFSLTNLFHNVKPFHLFKIDKVSGRIVLFPTISPVLTKEAHTTSKNDIMEYKKQLL